MKGRSRPEKLGESGPEAMRYPWLGWKGCQGTPWGRRRPTLAGCETKTCLPITKVLRDRTPGVPTAEERGPGDHGQ